MRNLNYSEFCLWIDENDDKVEYILEYAEWSVVKIDGRYYYYDHKIEDDSDKFCEVEPIAELHCNIINDVRTTEPLYYLFDYDVFGDQVTDNEIIYWWFVEV